MRRTYLVELGVDTDIRSSHLVFCECLDCADCTRGLLFEGALMQPLVEVDSVVPGHHIGGPLRFRLRLRNNAYTITNRLNAKEQRTATLTIFSARASD